MLGPTNNFKVFDGIKYKLIRLENVLKFERFRFDNKWWEKHSLTFMEVKNDISAERNIKYLGDYSQNEVVAVPLYKVVIPMFPPARQPEKQNTMKVINPMKNQDEIYIETKDGWKLLDAESDFSAAGVPRVIRGFSPAGCN